jgi:hypothetical protein
MADEGRTHGGRFAPGNKISPGRAPGVRRISTILQRIGEEEVQLGGETITKLEAVMRSVYSYALKGQSWAVHFIAERTEGKVADVVRTEVSQPTQVQGVTFVPAEPPDGAPAP